MVMAQPQPQELDMPDDDIERDSTGHFAKGNRGGPGRPRSVVSRGAVVLDEMGADAGKQIVQVMLDKALDGDMRAADLLLSRIWPARRGRPVEIDTTPIKSVSDYVSAATGVTNAVMRGEITAHEGRAVSSMLELQIKTIDYADITRQITELREEVAQLNGKTAV
jgi:hypothetical protein